MSPKNGRRNGQVCLLYFGTDVQDRFPALVNQGKEESVMYTFCLTFTVNGKKTEQIVRAHTIGDARKLIEAQYQGCSIRHISTGHERM